MPSTDAARRTLVLPRAMARVTRLTGLEGPGRSAPPSNRLSVDPGASTPISNPIFRSPFAPAAPRPQGGRGQSGYDAAHGRACRCRVDALPVAAPASTAATAAGHYRRITAEGGERIGVATSLARLTGGEVVRPAMVRL